MEVALSECGAVVQPRSGVTRKPGTEVRETRSEINESR